MGKVDSASISQIWRFRLRGVSHSPIIWTCAAMNVSGCIPTGLRAIVTVSFALMLCSCAITYTQPLPNALRTIKIKPGQPLVISSPEINYSIIADGTSRELSQTEADGPTVKESTRWSEVTKWTSNAAREELTKLGHTALVTKDAAAGLLCIRTTSHPSDVAIVIEPLCATARAELILCQHLSADLGTGAEWKVNPVMLGVYATPKGTTESTHLRAVIRQCDTGVEVWRGEAFYRGSPDTQDAAFQMSIRKLFQTIVIEGSQ